MFKTDLLKSFLPTVSMITFKQYLIILKENVIFKLEILTF